MVLVLLMLAIIMTNMIRLGKTVAMCVNDITAAGAEPPTSDYVATGVK